MEYELERKIKLSTDSEYEGLYKWALQEYDEKNEKVGSPQIPWEWGVDFKANDLQYIRTIEISSDDEPSEEKKAEVSDIEKMTAMLSPTQLRWGEWQDDYCSLSMLGTKREIKEIQLNIRPSKDENESCRLSGFPSYTADFDFEEQTVSDMLFVDAAISPDRFKEISELVRSKKIDICMVRLSSVSGFYSEWSPAVRTNKIKVLCAGSDQAIEVPDSCDITPPRLGGVQEFSLTLSSNKKMNKPRASVSDEAIQEEGGIGKIADLFDEEEQAEKSNNAGDWGLAQIARNHVILSKIKKLLWIIIFLLALIFLNLAA